MITRDKARELAMAKIRSNWSVPDDEPLLADEATREEDVGWVFFYNSKRYRETKKVMFALAGNGPVVVDRISGTVTMLGSAGSVDHQLSEYRRLKKADPDRQRTTRGK
jgi:Immunity protein 35